MRGRSPQEEDTAETAVPLARLESGTGVPPVRVGIRYCADHAQFIRASLKVCGDQGEVSGLEPLRTGS
jgi:hypothetical protein